MTGASPRALVALGSNLGAPVVRLRTAARDLEALGAVAARSSLWRTAPVGGPAGQPDYLNAVLALHPEPPHDDPETLLASLLAIERAHGRVRGRRWGARRLDLDLLDFGGAVFRSARLELPHPRLMERAFVLAPLLEVAPEWRHPASGASARTAFAALPAAVRGDVRRSAAGWGERRAAELDEAERAAGVS